MNGITVEHGIPILPCGPQTGNVFPILSTAFVGGVSDGVYGAAAMDTATHNLTGHRAWFFFDSGVVAVGANLTDPTPNEVWTTLASRLLAPNPAVDPTGVVTAGFANGSVAVLPDGAYTAPAGSGGGGGDGGALSWFHAGGHGYVPALSVPGSVPPTGPPGHTVGLTFGNTTGNWSAIGAFTGSFTGRLFTAYINHGAALAGDSFAYLITPNVSAAAMPGIAASSGFACLTNTAGVQGIAEPTSGIAQVIFWEAGGGTYTCAAGGSSGYALTVTASSAALVLVVEDADAGTLTVSASNPVTLGGGVSITVSRAATGPACAAAPGQPGATVFKLAWPTDGNYLGATVAATCTVAAAAAVRE
jgi:chondroitin AC lyase